MIHVLTCRFKYSGMTAAKLDTHIVMDETIDLKIQNVRHLQFLLINSMNIRNIPQIFKTNFHIVHVL